MPEYVVQRAMIALNDAGKSVKGSRILLLGLAYKADVDDMRESPTFELMDRFSALGGNVSYFDPHVPEIGPTREHAKWKGHRSMAWSEENIRAQDCIVIVTNHKAVNLQELANWAPLIVDTRNAMANIQGKAKILKS
jgi:UDP-N-acetyl-D-glucosamine dehydrogenase